MKTRKPASEYVLPPMKAGEQNPFAGHFPASITRYLTLWWWEQGPITKLSRGRVAFWEKLNLQPPRNAKPYCYLLNTVKFSSKKHGGKVYGECQFYDFNGLSSHLLGDPRTAIWYEATPAWILWRRGYWWAVFEGRPNTTPATLINNAWKNQ